MIPQSGNLLILYRGGRHHVVTLDEQATLGVLSFSGALAARTIESRLLAEQAALVESGEVTAEQVAAGGIERVIYHPQTSRAAPAMSTGPIRSFLRRYTMPGWEQATERLIGRIEGAER